MILFSQPLRNSLMLGEVQPMYLAGGEKMSESKAGVSIDTKTHQTPACHRNQAQVQPSSSPCAVGQLAFPRSS